MSVCLPGKQVPAYFTHKTKGNSISISPGTFSASSRFKACVLLTPSGQFSFNTQVVCHLKSKGVLINELEYTSCWHEVDTSDSKILTEHLFVFSGSLFGAHSCVEVDATTSEILFEFSCNVNDEKIIECGVQILTEEGESSTSKWKVQSEEAAEVSKDESVVKRSKHTGLWSWIKKLRLSE
ncbi:unnamed protein product [Microthlaspi erraticum]|uniref:C-JID domain-containing protein n=1 Tax=Microthlaspi erraticum TaxID=1685480 RepID=A0A6D2KQR8_9BRAS|nr:unnamed protein product [Microthlaspi erraticum]